MSIESYKGKKIEFHILQSFPVTCLNRDDVGSPKTAIVGGVTRARVSSQAWKRPVRMAMQEFGIKLGVRTKHIEEKIQEYCVQLGLKLSEESKPVKDIANYLAKDTLHFFSDSEAKALAQYIVDNNGTVNEKEIAKIHKKAFNPVEDGLDIALFGRMVAKAAELNVEAAVSFSHAISTHKVSNEIDFFTALDDFPKEGEVQQGSSHMGSLEFNSATYYRYVSIDLYQLMLSLNDEAFLLKAIEAFTKALYVAVPTARQTTQAGFAGWDYAKVLVRKGQNLQVTFENPIKAKGNGFLEPSIVQVEDFLTRKEKMSGSLFGKLGECTWGVDENFSIDDLISELQTLMRS